MDQKVRDFMLLNLQRLLDFLAASVRFVFGLLMVIVISTLTLSGEILDDLTTYKNAAIDWYHVAKVVVPPVSVSVIAYLLHLKEVSKALMTPPPGAIKDGQ